MNIYGIGTDIIKCERINKAWQTHGDHFARKILSSDELIVFAKLSNNQAAFLAKRFAAKEAVVKAFGTGFREEVLLTQISIVNDQLGKPNVELLGVTKEYADKLGIGTWQISIADEQDYVVAFAIAIAQS